MRFAVSLAMLLACLTTGCGSGSVAQAVADAEHCGGEALTPTLVTRLSRYSAGIPSTDVYVMQLCHPERGCRAVATYMHGMPPLAHLSAEQLRFVIPMAQDLRVFDDTAWVAGRQVPLAIEAWRIRTDEEVSRAYAAHGLDPRARTYRLDCWSDLSPRRYFATGS